MRRVGEGFPLKRAIPFLALPLTFLLLCGQLEAQASRPNVKFFYKAGKVVRQEMEGFFRRLTCDWMRAVTLPQALPPSSWITPITVGAFRSLKSVILPLLG